jgi:FkbM family methyltransferase
LAVSVHCVELQTSAALPLGASGTFVIDAAADVAWTAFVCYEAVVYPAPLAHGAGHGDIAFWPECPGAYRLRVVWTSGREAGVATQPFEVRAGERLAVEPQRARVNEGFEAWAPTGWDAAHVGIYERAALAAVSRYVRPGDAAYDIGANLGVYTMALLQAVGPTGDVSCFELNPVCVQMLQATVRSAGHDNCAIVPVALGAADGALEAVVNFGSTALGITTVSGAFGRKIGSRITVPCMTLDGAIPALGLRPPAFVKVDVEGAEAHVVGGMRRTVARHRPVLLIELHGRLAAHATLEQLDEAGYVFEDIETGRRAERAEAFMDGLDDRVLQVLCLPSPR